MTDEELLELARSVGWKAISSDIRNKLVAYGRAVVKRKNMKHRSQTDSGKQTEKGSK